MRTRRPRILLDVDGVMADFVTPVLAECNRVTGKTFTEVDVTQFDFLEKLGLDEYQVHEVHAAIGTPGFCRHLHMYPGVKEGVAELRAIGDVFAVTSPWESPYWMHERKVWLREELGFDKNRVFHGSAKEICHGDLLVEDRTSMLATWEDENTYSQEDTIWDDDQPDTRVVTYGLGVLFERPWNRVDEWHGLRVSSWPNLVALVEQYTKERY